jgi:hypothetical protein
MRTHVARRAARSPCRVPGAAVGSRRTAEGSRNEGTTMATPIIGELLALLEAAAAASAAGLAASGTGACS